MTSLAELGVVRLAWHDREPPGPGAVERRLRQEGVEPYAWSNGPGDRYGPHAHGYAKVLMCAAGTITFRVGPGQVEIELAPGDGFVLPAGIEHAAIVGPQGCICIEGRR